MSVLFAALEKSRAARAERADAESDAAGSKAGTARRLPGGVARQSRPDTTATRAGGGRRRVPRGLLRRIVRTVLFAWLAAGALGGGLYVYETLLRTPGMPSPWRMALAVVDPDGRLSADGEIDVQALRTALQPVFEETEPFRRRAIQVWHDARGTVTDATDSVARLVLPYAGLGDDDRTRHVRKTLPPPDGEVSTEAGPRDRTEPGEAASRRPDTQDDDQGPFRMERRQAAEALPPGIGKTPLPPRDGAGPPVHSRTAAKAPPGIGPVPDRRPTEAVIETGATVPALGSYRAQAVPDPALASLADTTDHARVTRTGTPTPRAKPPAPEVVVAENARDILRVRAPGQPASGETMAERRPRDATGQRPDSRTTNGAEPVRKARRTDDAPVVSRSDVRRSAGARDDLAARQRQAAQALRGGNPGAAAKAYYEVLDLAPRDPDALLGLAVAQQRLGLAPDARDTYGRLLDVEPDNDRALRNLVALSAQGEPAAAHERLDKLRRRYPGYAPLYAQLAAVQAGTGEMAAALASMRRAIQLAPRDIKFRYNLAVLYDRAGQPEAAARAYRQVLDAGAAGGEANDLPLRSVRRRLAYLLR